MSSDDSSTEILRMHALPVRPREREESVEVTDTPFVPEGERYQFIGTLGSGGMGDVRLAKDTRIARQVAVKVLRDKLRDQPGFRSRFLVEARLQGQLEHPAIVPVHDLGETPDGELFFSMKHVRGVTIHEAIKAGKVTRRRLLTAFSSVCLAVDFAHTRGVVHRDLKPANVMLGDFGEVYVLDWGIAKVVDRKDTPDGPTLEIPLSDDAVTRVGKVLGTPQYMAPERKKHGVADRRTDIFALGVMLSEILAAHADPPPELTAIVARATAREPDERFATARELQELLEKYLDGDRDLELRRVQSEEHAQLAEHALARTDDAARTDAGHEIGRALGLDPTNARALRTLMRLLTEVPAKLPPAAEAEVDRVWQTRRTRTLRTGTLLTLSPLLFVPFVLWMGVRDWTLFGLWVASAVAAGVSQWIAARKEATLPFIAAIVFAVSALFLMTTSMGLTALVPAAFAVVAMAWRITVRRWTHGLVVLIVLIATLCAPFALDWLGIRAVNYAIEGDALVLRPQMHHFPATATWVALVISTIGAVTAALLFGRISSNEIHRVERNLTFNAWQLQQLVPPSA